MKQLDLQLPDGNPAPITDFGNVAPGATTTARELRLVNTGDEPITSIKLRIVQDDANPGTYIVTANGVNLKGEWQEAATEQAPLAPGAFIVLSEAWSVPAGAAVGTDFAALDIEYLR